jgi:uncharacterized membrane protein
LIIPFSGIYLVRHKEHRLPHEVTLLKGQKFPVCAKCNSLVQFELLFGVDATLSPFRVVLNQIPPLEEEHAPESGKRERVS